MSVRAAYRWQRDQAAVPWSARVGLAVAFSLLFLAAGWGDPWWELVLVIAPWWALVMAGIFADVRSES